MALPQPQKVAAPKQPATAIPTQGGKEQAHSPQVDGFKLKGELKGSLKDIAALLRSISFLEIASEKDLVNVIYVESRDINKNPYLFSLLKIKEDEVEVLYSIPSEIGPKKRRMDVIRYLLNIFSLVEPVYEVDTKTLYQLVENAVKELTSSVTMDYSKLYTAYDSLKKDVDDLRKKVDRLNDQNQALTTKNYELKSQNDELHIRIGELEGLSDDALKAKLQEWITEHNGSIVIPEFTKLYKVSDARVEELLNRLVSEGYLEVVQ
jgi:regulator of replication initiation timing